MDPSPPVEWASMHFILCLVLLFFHAGNANAQMSLIDRVQKMQPSLVEVKTVYSKILRTEAAADPATGLAVVGRRMANFERSGTGLVIDPDGLVVTNTHIILNAPEIFVILSDGTKLPADVAFVSVGYDFSFLKVHSPRPLKAIQWADSSLVRLGQPVIATGNSDLNNESILSGEVSSIIQNRSTGEVELIEVNLSLYRGDSGGPVWDYEGRLLGMIMAKNKSQDRAGFAIASNRIHEQYLIYKRSNPS